jgi:deazaflavin-dependent oxidoreductase (nitroreductase family)
MAFALIRRADRAVGWPRQSPAARLREEGGILLAGAVMVLGGYVDAAWSWLLALPLFVAGGFAIAAAGLSGHHPEHKLRVVRASERYIANTPTKAALRLGLPTPLVLLETTGHKTAKPRRTPIMNGVIGQELWIVAEHGYRAAYVRNLLADPHVRVKTGRRWREGRAEVLDEDDPVARAGWIADQTGRSKTLERLAMRTFGVDPVTVRVSLSNPAPVAAMSAGRRQDRQDAG